VVSVISAAALSSTGRNYPHPEIIMGGGGGSSAGILEQAIGARELSRNRVFVPAREAT
jgi:hypothetical protein